MCDKKKSVKITISLPEDLLQEIDAAAESLACPRSVFIAMSVRQKLNSDMMMDKLPEMLGFLRQMSSNGCLPSESAMPIDGNTTV